MFTLTSISVHAGSRHRYTGIWPAKEREAYIFIICKRDAEMNLTITMHLAAKDCGKHFQQILVLE